MTGKVVATRVAGGEKVKKNDLLVVLHAMKMEYRLTSPREAEVLAVHCKTGDLVEFGAVLVSLSNGGPPAGGSRPNRRCLDP
jgi:biotin carboxyl carrier protein